MTPPAPLTWQEDGHPRSALWVTDHGARPPAKLMVVDDTLNADTAYRLACEGTGLLWRGDFQNARQLLQALKRRLERPARPKKSSTKPRDSEPSKVKCQDVTPLALVSIPSPSKKSASALLSSEKLCIILTKQ